MTRPLASAPHQPDRYHGVLAAFDFDGTLTRRDALLPFLATVTSWRSVATALSTVPWSSTRGQHRRDAAKQAVLARLLAGRSEAELHDRGRAFAASLLASPAWCNGSVLEQLLWHQARGHEVAIISGSLEVYLDHVAAALGAVASGVRLEFADGVATGRMLGPNVRGPEKLHRLAALVGDDDPTVVAYGNSSGDHALLAAADVSFLCRRGRLTRYRAAPTR